MGGRGGLTLPAIGIARRGRSEQREASERTLATTVSSLSLISRLRAVDAASRPASAVVALPSLRTAKLLEGGSHTEHESAFRAELSQMIVAIQAASHGGAQEPPGADDGTSEPAARAHAAAIATSPRLWDEFLEAHSAETVSYTHLTLPTKRIV